MSWKLFPDKPTVNIERSNSPVLEEGSGSASLICMSESNPPGQVMWLKVGENTILQYKEVLEFNPVTREHAEEQTGLNILC